MSSNLELLRRAVTMMAACWVSACHRPALTWPTLATQSGCTEELLAGTPAYDSSRVRSLAGSYRLIQIDTARGWIETFPPGRHPTWPELRLWLADSAHAHWRQHAFTRAPMSVNRPIAGALVGHQDDKFTADNPQVEVESNALDQLVVRFTPEMTLDGPIWLFPIQHLGAWGFGGYFEEGSYVVPAGKDGKALGQRAGFYCAVRQ